MALEIPHEDIVSLYNFSLYSSEVKEEIYSILKELKLGDTPKKIAKNISTKFELEFSEIFDILLIYFSLLRTLHYSHKTDDEVIADLNDNIIEHDFDFDAEDLKLISEVVLSFIHINNDIPLITAIAYDNVAFNPKLYLNSKFVQDLRPVFFKNEIRGMALYNTIRIHYEAADKSHQNIFLSLDVEDIENLTEQLAEAKKRIEDIKEKFGDLIIQI